MKYEEEDRPTTVLEVQLALDRFRTSQKYIFNLPKRSEERKALEPTILLAYKYLAQILQEHGIDTIEDMIAFELGNITKWRK